MLEIAAILVPVTVYLTVMVLVIHSLALALMDEDHRAEDAARQYEGDHTPPGELLRKAA